MENDTIVEVTLTKLYILPTKDKNEIDKLIQDWFSKEHMTSYHAFRDSSDVYGFHKFIDYKILE
jgi:hypothetical protein